MDILIKLILQLISFNILINNFASFSESFTFSINTYSNIIGLCLLNLYFFKAEIKSSIGHFSLIGISLFLKSLFDALRDMLPRDKLKDYLNTSVIEVAPLAYMRGRTLHDSFIILDEAQNATKTQMKMFLTRLGVTSKSIITGDITQIDLPPKERSGLVDAIWVLKKFKGITFVNFDENDLVRHKLVKDIIKAYGDNNGN